RHEKHRVLLPFEVLLRLAVAGPDGSQTAARANINNLIQGELDRRQRLTGRDFGHTRGADAFLAPELNKGGLAASFFPPFQLDGAEIGNEIALVDRNALRLHPTVIGKFLAPHRDDGFLFFCFGHRTSSLLHSLFLFTYLLVSLLATWSLAT